MPMPIQLTSSRNVAALALVALTSAVIVVVRQRTAQAAPPIPVVRLHAPAWSEMPVVQSLRNVRLDSVPRPGRQPWRAHRVSAIAAGAVVAVAEASNSEILFLDAASLDPTHFAGGFGQGPTELDTPGDIAVVGRTVLVVDKGNQRVAAFDSAGAPQFVPTLPGLPISIDAKGNDALAISWSERRVQAFRWRCCTDSVWHAVPLNPRPSAAPRQLVMLDSGRFAMLLNPVRIVVYEASGAARARLTTFVRAPGQADSSTRSIAPPPNAGPEISSIALAPDGNLTVSFGHSVACLDWRAGRFTNLWRPARSLSGPMPTIGEAVEGTWGTLTLQGRNEMAVYPRVCGTHATR